MRYECNRNDTKMRKMLGNYGNIKNIFLLFLLPLERIGAKMVLRYLYLEGVRRLQAADNELGGK